MEEVHVDHDGQRLAIQVHPTPDGDGPVVVLLPAMGVPARYYRPFATSLHGVGVGLIVPDLRGTGGSTPRPSRRSTYGFAELVDDVDVVLRFLAPRLAGRPLLLAGHSLGGQLAALHLARTAVRGPAPEVPTTVGLALIAVGLPYFRVYERQRAGVLVFTQGINAASTALGVWPGWGFGGRQARGVVRDWAYTARTGRFPRLHGLDMEAALAEVRVPVLGVSVSADQYTPSVTTDHLCRKFTGTTVTRHHYKPTESGARMDHFTWVRAADALATRLSDFASVSP